MLPLLDPNDDQKWLSSLRASDETALRRIFERHYAPLVHDVHRIIRDEDSCRDMVQEVFVELWRKRESLDIHTSLRAYLRRAAINRALNYLKANQKLDFDAADHLHAVADTSDQDLDRQNRQERLEQAIHLAMDTLPEKCRAVFSLSRFEQLSHREIAERLGISVKTIENQITKAMKIMREAVKKHDELSAIVILLIKCCWEA